MSGATAARVEQAVDESFVGAFRLAMYVAAGLALASALAAAIIIEGKGQTAPVGRVSQPGGEGAPA